MTNASTLLEQMPLPIQREAPVQPDRIIAPNLKIGSVCVGFPAVQAALSGYSDGPMRRIARRMGATYTLAEVMIDRFLRDLKSRQRTRQYLELAPEEHPVGGQLMGSDPAAFGPAATRLVEAGFDVIDINFGCPVKSTAGACRGGYHLGQPEVALEIVSRTREIVPSPIPVTLKMRRGLDDTSESRDRFYQILDGAFARGVSAITVHGRTVAQSYVGPSNWDFLREVKQHVGDRTILGSGDLFTAQACLGMLRHTGVDGVSIARGAIGNPWIFSQVKALAEGLPMPEPTLHEQSQVMEQQYELCLESTDDRQALTTMRMFGMKFARLHPEHASVRNAFAKSQSREQWREVLNFWY